MSMVEKSFLESKMDDLEFRAEMTLAELAMDLAESIKETRIALNMTQAELADKIMTKQSQVSRYENTATAKFTLNSLAKLADALNCVLAVSLTPKAYVAHGSSLERGYIAAANNVIKFPPSELSVVA